MRLERIPYHIKKTPWKERKESLQGAVNEILNKRNICPVGEYVAGPRTFIIHVAHQHGHWHIFNNWNEDERHLQWVAEELERMR